MSYSSLCGLSPVKLEGVVLQDGILNILFYRYISEKLCKNINDNEKKAGNNNFDYSQSTDGIVDAKTREDIIKEAGIPYIHLNCSVMWQKNANNNPNFNIKLAKVFISKEY